MNNRPKMEAEINNEKEELEEVNQKLKEIKKSVRANKAHLAKSKAQLEVEVNKKKQLEENVLKVEKILDLMRKELKKIIQNANQVTFVPPEEYTEFKKEASKKIMLLLDEKSKTITRNFKKKTQGEYNSLQHVEEKANEIDRLVAEIKEKERIQRIEQNKLTEAEKKLELSKEELKQNKQTRQYIHLFLGLLIVIAIFYKVTNEDNLK